MAAYWRHMVPQVRANIGSGNGLSRVISLTNGDKSTGHLETNLHEIWFEKGALDSWISYEDVLCKLSAIWSISRHCLKIS